jgi:hypothetical protein
VPVTFRVYEPTGVVDAFVITDNVDVPDPPFTVDGVNDDEAPGGSPLMVKPTFPVKPLCGVMVIV